MQQIKSVNCGNNYTPAATLSEIIASSGGYFAVSGNDALVELQYGPQGTTQWTGEAQVPVGNGVLDPGTTGVRFRNATAGSVAVVTAALYEEAEPRLVITSPGTVSVSGSLSGVTGIVSAAGAILGGTGFTVAHPGLGQYVITFTTAFAAVPVLLAMPIATGGALFAFNDGIAITSGGGQVNISSDAGALVSAAFNFVAFGVV